MKSIPVGAILAVSTCFVACSCITGGVKQEDQVLQKPAAEVQAPEVVDAPRVMANWQQRMDGMLAERASGDEAFGLFSYGGWANAGQYIVFMNRDRSSARLALVEPSSKEINKERDLTAVELQRLNAQLKAVDALDNVVPDKAVFDAIEYEFVHTRKDGDKLLVLKRIYMQNPGGTGKNGSSPHMAMIQAFEELRTPEK